GVGFGRLTQHHLHHAGGVTQVDEGHPAVVAPPGHPSGQGHGLAGVRLAQRAGLVGTDHGVSFAVRCRGHSLKPPARTGARAGARSTRNFKAAYQHRYHLETSGWDTAADVHAWEDPVLLTQHEQERLLIHVAADIAWRRRQRGLRLNYPEAVAVITAYLLE